MVRVESFGRRVATYRPPRRGAAAQDNVPDFEHVIAAETPFPPQQSQTQEPSPDEELQAWKAERRRARLSRIPWRQLSLMASLCFGIATFVLPDSMNDTVDWLLYGLMAASFIAGFARRRRA
mgnify:FL=1